MSVPALEARRLCKVIGNRIILSDIEFSLVPGVCTGLLGRNGAGKSSLLRMLAGLIKPDFGEILVFGRSAMAEERWGDFAWLPENFTLPAFLSGEEFMRMQLRLRKREGWPWRDLLRCLDLPETCLRRSLGECSAGMQQKFGLLAALASGAEILLLDEPMSRLDPRARRGLCEYLRGAGQTILFSTHLLADAEQFCDQLILLEAGRIRYAGSVADCRLLAGADNLEEAWMNWTRPLLRRRRTSQAP